YPLIDAGEAAAFVLEHTPVLSVERLALAECAGRALAEDLVADAPLPAFPSSAVDGFAVHAADAGRTLRVVGESAAGRPFDGAIPPGAAARILTGGALPAGAEVHVLGIAPDEPEPLRRLVVDALEDADALVTSGGVSVGTHDLVKPLLESLGTVHIGRVKLKPGKPFTFATIGIHAPLPDP